MRITALMTFIFMFSTQALAQEWQQTVMIDEATCSYDRHGFPKIRVVISPAIKIDQKDNSTFTEALAYKICPDMNDISDRLYTNVTLRVEQESFYSFDTNGICNRYDSKKLLMFIPVPGNSSSNYLKMLLPINITLKERNLSIGYCDGGH